MHKHKKVYITFAFLVFSLFFISMTGAEDVSQNLIRGTGGLVSTISGVDATNIDQRYIFLVGLGKEDNYIPDMKLLVSIDNGENWTENTKNLKMGQSFYLMFEASCRVPGIRLQMFGAKSIIAYITIPKETIISFGIDDSDTAHVLLARDPDDPDDYDFILFTIPTSPLDDNALARGARPNKVSMILKCIPEQRGAQRIFVEYEDKVDSSYTKTFTLEIN